MSGQASLPDLGAGLAGVSIILAALLTPFLRAKRNHWGLGARDVARPLPGDEFVPEPSWAWTHGVEIPAPPERVWPWVAQLGADRGGFYSYQWLENLVGCQLRNACTIHPEWRHHVGSSLVLHPRMPGIPIVAVEPNRALVAFARANEEERKAGRSWAAASWAFVIEELGDERSRLISRFRTKHSNDWATRLARGPGLLEPIGFAMDRRMLLGVSERVRAAGVGVVQ